VHDSLEVNAYFVKANAEKVAGRENARRMHPVESRLGPKRSFRGTLGKF